MSRSDFFKNLKKYKKLAKRPMLQQKGYKIFKKNFIPFFEQKKIEEKKAANKYNDLINFEGDLHLHSS